MDNQAMRDTIREMLQNWATGVALGRSLGLTTEQAEAAVAGHFTRRFTRL